MLGGAVTPEESVASLTHWAPRTWVSVEGGSGGGRKGQALRGA